ncbi:MAG: DNA gyrase inhibitor YacG [Proteobacteria bacterium]|nr:DNA gyrase inhibitor YacG [Pseudomonadota bacterium]
MQHTWQHTCPICRRRTSRPIQDQVFPFCSQRCKQVDLGNWLHGRYVVGSELVPERVDGSPCEARQDTLSEHLERDQLTGRRQ